MTDKGKNKRSGFTESKLESGFEKAEQEQKGAGGLMGRNRQGIEPRKNYTVRLSEQEQKTLLQKAGECGLKPSQYIRKLITEGGMVDVFLPEQRRDFINQIARIGNNINQIAHRANANGWISEWSVKRAEDSLKEVQKLMKEVLAKWR